MKDVKAVRSYIHVQCDSPITTFTGELVKTFVYTLAREVRLYRGVRGIVSPIHISPLFKPGRKDYELGELVTPIYKLNKNGSRVLLPVSVDGEYIIHIGGDSWLVDVIASRIGNLKVPLAIKIYDSICVFKVISIEDVTENIMSKSVNNSDKVTLYLKGPVKEFNIFTTSKLPRFNISAVDVLATPYLFYRGIHSITLELTIEMLKTLGHLIETYYSISTVKPVLIPFKQGNNGEPSIIGKITYIIDTNNPQIRDKINAVLNIAEIVGVGRSRQNGFGSTTWKPK